ncbi:hypothetical protein ACQ7HM_01880 [Williamsia sp. MIQD14]|uniref:hypothetical protein n=1 Tax=Williamsia sp. MIQD14 TaxID=3425703 RepID=UPI003DA13213
MTTPRATHFDTDAPQDARALVGLHTTGAKIVVAIYLGLSGFAILVITPPDTASLASTAVSLLILTVATVGIIVIPTDPLPLRAAVPMASAGAVSCGVALTFVDPSARAAGMNWIHALGTAILCFLCVRGRTNVAWVGMALMLGAFLVAAIVGPARVGVGPQVTLIDVAPLSMATVFSLTLRPSATLIFELRRSGARRSAELAAQTAAAAERDAQLAELDKLARPMLDRIAAGDELTPAERESCGLLEAHLRDRLRAPGLATTEVADAARAARSRGVEVILLDDDPMRSAPIDALVGVRAVIVDILESSTSGDVRVRLLPPNRSAMASVVVRDGGDMYRRDFGSDGSEIVRSPVDVDA